MSLPSIFLIVRGSDFLKVGDDVLVCASREQAETVIVRLEGGNDPVSGFPTTSLQLDPRMPRPTKARVVEYVPKVTQ